MPLKLKLSAVILAGGLSSRMQEFKPLLPLAGTMVIEHVIDLFQQAGIDDIIVVVGHQAARVIPFLTRRQVRFTLNDRYREGMYSSVMAGVHALPEDTEAFFLLPVDVPLVKPHSIRLLARNFIQHRNGVTYPVFQGQRGHPPLVSSHMIPRILAGDRPDGLRGLLAEQEELARDVELVDEGVLMDMDTPEDYRKICDQMAHRGIPTPAECESILSRMQTPEAVIRHGRKVASTACSLAQELNHSGLNLDLRWVEAAGLLHDLAKGKQNHARKGGQILQSLGYSSVAKSISQHMDLEFSATDPITETVIVHLADKLIQYERCVSIEARFAPAFAKYPQGHSLEPLISHRFIMAKAIAREVERKTGKTLLKMIPPEHGS